MTKPLIMVAPNGAHLSKQDHPELSITISETITAAQKCFEAGATALHLHVRDHNGVHSLDAGLYREAITEMGNQLPAMRVQITTEAAGMFSVEEQLDCLNQVKPDWASISVKEIARAPELASSVYAACEEMGTEVQHILYDVNDAALLQEWQRKGIIRKEQNSVLLVLGRYSKNQISSPKEIQPFLSALPTSNRWMLCAFGATEHACLKYAVSLGGDCRVGFENSRTNSSGMDWPDNAASVSALCDAFYR